MAKPLLFEPITLRSTEFRNRLWISPMCQYQASNGLANDWHTVHYGGLARGGAGLVVVESTGVMPEGRISPACLGLWNDQQAEALRPVVDSVHRWGGKIAVQLAHAGRKASLYPMHPGAPDGTVPPQDGGWQTVGPTSEPFRGLDAPVALDAEGIQEIIDAFVSAASRAVSVGFDALEIHGAHGYIISSFLSPLVNTRDDEWGGSLENRARLLREVVRGIRARHPDVPLVVRISASDWLEGGFSAEDGAALAAMLNHDGADLIDVSSAANVPESQITVGPSYQTRFAPVVRAGGLPVGTVGMILNAEQAETILVMGLADVVSIGRVALRNPFAPLQWAQDLRADSFADLVPDSYYTAWPRKR